MSICFAITSFRIWSLDPSVSSDNDFFLSILASERPLLCDWDGDETAVLTDDADADDTGFDWMDSGSNETEAADDDDPTVNPTWNCILIIMDKFTTTNYCTWIK